MFESKLNKGKSNGYTPLNNDTKVDKKYLPDDNIGITVISVDLATLGLSAFGTDAEMLLASKNYLTGLSMTISNNTLVQLEITDGSVIPITPIVLPTIDFCLTAFQTLSSFNFPSVFMANDQTYTLNNSASFEANDAGQLAYQQAVVSYLNTISGLTATLPNGYDGSTIPNYSISLDMNFYPTGFTLTYTDPRENPNGRIYSITMQPNNIDVVFDLNKFDLSIPSVVLPIISSKYHYPSDCQTIIPLGVAQRIPLTIYVPNLIKFNLANFTTLVETGAGPDTVYPSFPYIFTINNNTYEIPDTGYTPTSESELLFHQTVVGYLNTISGLTATLDPLFNGSFLGTSYLITLDMNYYPSGFNLNYHDSLDSHIADYRITLEPNLTQVVFNFGWHDISTPLIINPIFSDPYSYYSTNLPISESTPIDISTLI